MLFSWLFTKDFLMRAKCSKPLVGGIILSSLLVSLAAGADYSFYPNDDFNETCLNRRGYIHNTDVSFSSGKVRLTNGHDATGSITLKGVYTASRIYLEPPWSMETLMILPEPGPRDSDLPYNGGLGVTLCNNEGGAI
jgi:hypothetical protein